MRTILNFREPRQGWPDNSPGSAPALRSASDEGGKNEHHPGKKTQKAHSPPRSPPKPRAKEDAARRGAEEEEAHFPVPNSSRTGTKHAQFSTAHYMLDQVTPRGKRLLMIAMITPWLYLAVYYGSPLLNSQTRNLRA